MEKKLFDELVESLVEAQAIARGLAEPSRSFIVEQQLKNEGQEGDEAE